MNRCLVIVLILSALFGFAPSVCTAGTVKTKDFVLFDDWASEVSRDMATSLSAVWISPSKKFAFSEFRISEDTDGFILFGQTVSQDNKTTIGYGARGISVQWYPSSEGEIAVISLQIDNGTNCLYAILPSESKEQLKWNLLYKTPELQSAGGHCIAHCHWAVRRLNGQAGILSLSASWDYSDVTNMERKKQKTGGEFSIPLFYGSQ